MDDTKTLPGIGCNLQSQFPIRSLTKALRIALYLGAGASLLTTPVAQALNCPVSSPTQITSVDTNVGNCTIEATGTVDITTGSLSNLTGAQLNNLGSLNTQSTANLNNQAGAGITNTGNLSNTAGGSTIEVRDNGTYGVLTGNSFINSGSLRNQQNANIVNEANGLLVNDGSFTNLGSIENHAGDRAVIERCKAQRYEGSSGYGRDYYASVYDACAWETANGIVNNNNFSNLSGSTFTNHADALLDNTGIFSNSGILTNNAGNFSFASDCSPGVPPIGLLHGFRNRSQRVHCDWTLNGGIRNTGSLTNQSGGVISNAVDGAFANYGSLQNAGTLTNSGRLINEGNLTNESGGLLVNEATGIIINSRIRRVKTAYPGRYGELYPVSYNGAFINNGTVDNRGIIAYTPSFTNNGTLENQPGARIDSDITNSGVVNNHGYLKSIVSEASGTLNNAGNIDFHHVLSGAVANNTGTIGSLRTDAGSTVYNQGTLAHGAIINGTLHNDNDMVTDNVVIHTRKRGCSITGGCSYYYFSYNSPGLLSVGENGLINNRGHITLKDQSKLSVSGTINNNGIIENLGSNILVNELGAFNGTGSLSLQDSYSIPLKNTYGSILEVNGVLSQNSITLADRSEIIGAGQISSTNGIHVNNLSTIRPGVKIAEPYSPPECTYYGNCDDFPVIPPDPTYGTLRFVNTDLTLAGTLVIDVAGINTFDMVEIFGNITFAAGSQIIFDFHNYLPSASNQFDVVLAETVSGVENLDYAIVGLDTSALNLTAFLELTQNQDLRLMFTDTAEVPIPASLWLFGSGLLGLAGIHRRRKETRL